jgi:hypothetical protein
MFFLHCGLTSHPQEGTSSCLYHILPMHHQRFHAIYSSYFFQAMRCTSRYTSPSILRSTLHCTLGFPYTLPYSSTYSVSHVQASLRCTLRHAVNVSDIPPCTVLHGLLSGELGHVPCNTPSTLPPKPLREQRCEAFLTSSSRAKANCTRTTFFWAGSFPG